MVDFDGAFEYALRADSTASLWRCLILAFNCGDISYFADTLHEERNNRSRVDDDKKNFIRKFPVDR